MSAGGGGDVRKERGEGYIKRGGPAAWGRGNPRRRRLVSMADTATAAIPCGKRRGARRAVGWAFGPVGARAVFFLNKFRGK